MTLRKYYFLLILFSFFISSCITGSTDDAVTWEKNYDLNPQSHIIQLSSGDFVTAGYDEVMKLEPNGKQLWTSILSDQIPEGDYNFQIMEIIEIEDGFAVGGYAPKENDEHIVMFVELNSEGEVMNQNTIHEDFSNKQLALRKIDEGYILASNFGIANEMKVVRSFKLNSSGTITDQYSYEISNSENKFVREIIILPNNSGYIVETAFSGSSSENVPAATVTKLTKNMEKMWSTSIGNSNTEENDIVDGIEANDGSYLFAGRMGRSAWCFKITNDGTVAWQKEYGQSDQINHLFNIAKTDNGYVLAGSNLKNGNFDAAIYRINSNGSLEWSNTFGYAHYNDAKSVIQSKDSGFIFTGANANNPSGHEKAWILKLNSEGKLK